MRRLERLGPVALTQNGYVTRAQALEVGVSDMDLLQARQSGALLRRHRGVYVLGQTYDDGLGSLTRSLRAVASHETAAALWGADVLATPERRQLTVPRNRGRRVHEVDGVRLHRQDLGAGDVVERGGVRLTAPLRTALDVARARPLLPALVVLDSMLHRGLVTVEELAGGLRQLSSDPRRGAATRACSLADGRAESAFETRTRHVFWTHGLAPDELQWKVWDPWTRRWQRADLGWKRARLVGECDGFVFHSGREPFRVDRRRYNAYSRARLWQVHFTWEDLDDEPYLVDLVRGFVSPPLPG